MLLPEPIVIPLEGTRPPAAWTTYVTPASTWGTLPVSIGFASAPPSLLLDADAVAALDVAGRAWSTPTCTDARFAIVATALVGDPAADGKNQIFVHRDDWPPPLTTGAAAHTVIYTLGDRIVEADIHVNAYEFQFTLGSAPPKIDLRAILTHELGHVLGIGHSAESRATMSAGLLSGIGARSLETDDLAAICALYPGTHDDACVACPTGHTCVGFECQRANEPGTEGHACATVDSGEPRPCDGAGDRARCVSTSKGAVCARECRKTGDACGGGLACVIVDGDDPRCLPLDAQPSDAGVEAGIDSGSDADGAAGNSVAPARDGCSCKSAPRSGAQHTFAGLLVFVLMLRSSTNSIARKPRGR